MRKAIIGMALSCLTGCSFLMMETPPPEENWNSKSSTYAQCDEDLLLPGLDGLWAFGALTNVMVATSLNCNEESTLADELLLKKSSLCDLAPFMLGTALVATASGIYGILQRGKCQDFKVARDGLRRQTSMDSILPTLQWTRGGDSEMLLFPQAPHAPTER